jgi:GNAT superfamily N-acetyltransferase
VTPHIREAGLLDLPVIVRLHEADELGGHGDAWNDTNRAAYEAAFAAIQRSADNAIFVAELGGEVVGVFQLTFVPTITGRGSLRARLGGVQVAAGMRSHGIGARMVAHAEQVARARGAASLELTSNGQRVDAHRFYERLGFRRSHQGFKKSLSP